MVSETSHPDTVLDDGNAGAAKTKSRPVRFWIPFVVCVLAVPAIPVAFILGAVIGNMQVYNNMSSHQESRIKGFLRRHPSAYSRLSVEHASNGWAYPSGIVPTQGDYDRLNGTLHTMFGDESAAKMMVAVEVEGNRQNRVSGDIVE